MTVAKKSKKSVTYILGPTQFHQGHSLGVNALQFSKSDNRLFSAGRDGIVSGWSSSEEFGEIDYPLDDLDNKLSNYTSIHDYASTSYDNESELVFLESQIRKGINFHLPKYGNYKMSNHAQVHSDWINDIKLLNDDKSIVSCSSDLSVKIWDSSKNDLVTAIGYHTDYVRCLAYTLGNPRHIISGSLDKSISIWDLDRQHQVASIKDSDNERGSVYALSCLPNLIAGGGPENVIKLYDSRSNSIRATKKLSGHQGNIKSLILKNNYILSGSADSTVKIWCLRTNRVLRTFDMHDSSIWSLECPDEENQNDDLFNVFYSGDRNGLIIKTDLKACNYDYYYANNSIITGKLNESLGVSTVIADLSNQLIDDDETTSEPHGVLSIKFGDNSIWSSSSSVMSTSARDEDSNAFIKRWAIPSTNKLVTYQSIKLLRNLSIYNNGSTPMTSEPTDLSLTSVVSDPFQASNIVSDDLYDLVSHLSNNSTYEVSKLDEITRPTRQFDLKDDEYDDDDIFLSPFLSTNGGPNGEFIINNDDDDDDDDEEEVDRVKILHNSPPKPIRTIPIAVDPIQKIEGQSGLVKHRLLNDRRHVVTMDTSGTIKVWDLIKSCALETVETTKPESQDPMDMLEYKFNEVIDKYQTNETLPMWCKVEIKSGKLFITLDESSFSNTEIYLDQLLVEFPYLERQYAQKYTVEELEDKKISCRINLGRMVLKNIFRRFIKEELLQDSQYRHSRRSNSDLSMPSISRLNTLDLNIPEVSLDKSGHENLESIMSNDASKSVPVQPPPTMPAAVATLPALSKKPSNDDHKRKFKFFGKSSRSGSTSSTVDKPVSSASSVVTTESHHNQESTYSLVQEIRSKYDSKLESGLHIGELELPFIELASNTLLIISELSNNSTHELFHGNLNEYIDESTLIVFEKILPRWCGNALLLSKFPAVAYTKINFIIEEYKGYESNLAPITQSSNKLNAVSVLRAHKIASFIIERLDSKPVEAEQPGFKAHEFLELVCVDQVIPFDMTLATMKARIWKKSGDVVLNYRRKVV